MTWLWNDKTLTLATWSQWRIYIVKFWTRAPPSGGPNSFNFMQFLGNFGKIVCWRPPGELAPPPRGNPGSATGSNTFDYRLICHSIQKKTFSVNSFVSIAMKSKSSSSFRCTHPMFNDLILLFKTKTRWVFLVLFSICYFMGIFEQSTPVNFLNDILKIFQIFKKN